MTHDDEQRMVRALETIAMECEHLCVVLWWLIVTIIAAMIVLAIAMRG